MTYVVVEPCVKCRYTDCADDEMLVINPETCIDCDACVPECPVEAIFPEDKVPEEWAHYTQINAEKSLSGLPIISEKLDPLC
jgi:ferredoxin